LLGEPRAASGTNPVIHIALPLTDDEARQRITIASFPLVDALFALWLIANDVPGTPRLAALRDRLTGQEARAVAAWFGPPLPLGLLTLGLAAGEDDPARIRPLLRDVPDTDTITFAFALSGTRTNDAPVSPGVYHSLTRDADWAREYVHRYLTPPLVNPAPLLAAIADLTGTRAQLADTLTPIFATHIAPALPRLIAESEDAAARLEAAFVAEPAQFVARTIPLVAQPQKGVRQIACWPSAFLAAGAIAFPTLAGGDILVAIGMAALPRDADPTPLAPITAEAATYQDVYRLLADPVRWEIVRLLVSAPRYGQELAERLDLSIATVSHHLNGLKKLELVDIVRAEHRLYFHLRADRLRGLLAGAEHGLLDGGQS